VTSLEKPESTYCWMESNSESATCKKSFEVFLSTQAVHIENYSGFDEFIGSGNRSYSSFYYIFI